MQGFLYCFSNRSPSDSTPPPPLSSSFSLRVSLLLFRFPFYKFQKRNCSFVYIKSFAFSMHSRYLFLQRFKEKLDQEKRLIRNIGCIKLGKKLAYCQMSYVQNSGYRKFFIAPLQQLTEVYKNSKL